MDRELISEPLAFEFADLTREGAAPGEPSWPLRFRWRGDAFEVERVERMWKTTDAGIYTSGDTYVRRHYLDVETVCGARMRLYTDRGGRPGGWFLHSRAR